jgi:hypothetical protein
VGYCFRCPNPPFHRTSHLTAIYRELLDPVLVLVESSLYGRHAKIMLDARWCFCVTGRRGTNTIGRSAGHVIWGYYKVP